MSSYEYVITLPFNPINLINNINNSIIIVTPLAAVALPDINLTVTFQSALSTPEQTELTNLVNNNSTIVVRPPTSANVNVVKAITTTAGTLSTSFVIGQIIDGITLKKNDLILIKNQTSIIENGIYSVTSGAPTRANLSVGDNAGGTMILANQGTVNANSMWICTNVFGSDLVGTNGLIFGFSGTQGSTATTTLLYVKKTGASVGQFTSVKSALDSITDSSPTNMYTVHVSSGVYIEAEMTIPTCVNLIGDSIDRVIIEPDASNHHVINMGTNTELSFLTIRGAGAGFAGVKCQDIGDFGQLHKVAIQDCDIGILCIASTIDTHMFTEYVEIDNVFTYGIKVESLNGFQMFVTLESFFTFPIANPGLIAQVYGSGSKYVIEFFSGEISGLGTEYGIFVSGAGRLSAIGYIVSACKNGIYFDDGADVVLSGINFNNCNVGVLCGANGATPNIISSGTLYDNCTRDTQINNLSCTGQVIGIINYNKIHINSNTPITINGVVNNVITVAKSGGYFTSIANAIAAISVVFANVTLTNASAIVTSSGLFSPIMTSYQITGTGIAANTTVTYVDDNTIQLSLAATITGTSTITLLRSNATTNFTITIGPGTFVEAFLDLPNFVNLKGIDVVSTKITALNSSNTHVVQMGTSSTLQGITFDGTAIQNISGRSTVFCNGTLALSAMENCIISNSNVGLEINATDTNVVQFAVRSLVFVDCFKCISVDATAATNGSNTLNVTFGSTLVSYKTINPTTCITLTGPQGFIVFNNFQAIGTNQTNGSIGFDISDGCICVISSVYLKDWNYGILNSQTGAGSSIQISNSTVTSCTRHLEINNDSTIGFFTGNLDVGKAFISTISTFYISDVKKNILTVAGKGAEFTNINAALSSINPTISINVTNGSTTATSTSASFFKNLNNSAITAGSGLAAGTTVTYVNDSTITLSLAATATQTMDAKFTVSSVTNQYIISIGPGTYVESPVVLDNYVSLVGSGTATTILTSATVTGPFITIGEMSSLDSVSIYGIAGPGGIAVKVSPSATRSFLLNSAITYCETCIHSSNPTQPQELFIKGCGIVGPFTNALFVESNTGNKLTVYYSQSYHQIFSPGSDVVYCNGSDVDIKILASIFVYEGFAYTGIKADDGAVCNVNGCFFYSPNIAIHDTNTGNPKKLIVDDCVFDNSTTYDIKSEHPTTTGSISTSGDMSKVLVTSSLISVIYSAVSGNANLSMIGTLSLGNTQANLTNVSDLIFDAPLMGLIDGGAISIATGLQINISSGFGYCSNGAIPNHVVKRISWNATTNLALTANSTLYVYYSFTGTLSTAASKPSVIGNIILGRVRTGAATIEFIDRIPVKMNHNGNHLEDYSRDVFGSIFVTGSLVTVNASLEISVSSGKYYFGGVVYNPSGSSSPTTFTTYYHSISAFTFAGGVTIIDNTQYDNLTNLTALTASYYVKHSLYLVGDVANERYFLVYGQAEHALLADAQNGPLSSPPSYFSEGVVIIASIIVQQGSIFSEVTSQRPLPSFSASSLSTTLQHGSLLGLLNDDHPQYLLTDGTRTLTGNLDLGTNNIINAGTVNGVTVGSHASRHLPNGLDALTTAAPTTINGSTVINLTGVANSFSRSDHVHAVSLSTFEINQLGATVPLSVAKGGSGASTLTAGNFLTGNGTNQINSTKVVPSGAVVGTIDTQTLTNKTIIDSSNIISAFLRGGNITVVDTINGNDGTASINGLPFQTIAAALIAATSGTTIWIFPGTYNESSLVVPSGVCLRGINSQLCIISSTVTTSTTLITIGDNCRLEDLTLTLIGNTSAAITLQAVLFSGTSASTSKIRTTVINVSSTSNNNVTAYGIRSNGTGIPSTFASVTVRGVTITATATLATNGNAYALYVDSASAIYMTETNCLSIGGAGITSYGIVTNHASGSVRLRSGSTAGNTGDYLVSAGNIDFSGVQLSTSSTIFSTDSNQLTLKRAGFSTTINAQATADRVINLFDATDMVVGRATTDTLTNKSLSNSTTSFVDSTTASKAIKFDTSGALASSTLTLAGVQTTNRTLTFPNLTDNIVSRASTDTLMNKTLTAPIISTIVNTGTLTLPTKTGTIATENANTIRVEKGGNDSTGSRGGTSFLTITAALVATGITSGDIVKVSAGTYSSETFPLVLPSGISLVADDNVNTIISAAAVTSSTTIIQMGTSSLLSGFNLNMTSATTGLTLIGVSFPSTTAATARITGVNVNITNTVAGAVTIHGISSTGTGIAPDTLTSINNSIINCTAPNATSGNVRGIMISSASAIRMFRSIINAVSGAGANGTGVETSNASAVFTLADGSASLTNVIKGTTSSLFKTSGTINIPLYRGEYGNGSDGNVIMDGVTTFNIFSALAGSTYTLSRDSFIDTLTLNANIILNTNGYRLFIRNALIMNNGSNINNNGNEASGLTPGLATNTGTLGTGSLAAAGRTNNANGNAATGQTNAISSNTGGSGGNSTARIGGTTAASTLVGASFGGIQCLNEMTSAIRGIVLGGISVITVNGGSGGSGGASDGAPAISGSGGSGGGPIIVSARLIMISGNASITSTGGNGSNATGGNASICSGGGGSGQGGYIVFISNTDTSLLPTLTVSANGGTPGTGSGTNGTSGGTGGSGTIITFVH